MRSSPLFREDVLRRAVEGSLSAPDFPCVKHTRALQCGACSQRDAVSLGAHEDRAVRGAAQTLAAYVSAATNEGLLRSASVQKLRYAQCGCWLLLGDDRTARLELERLAKELRPRRRAGADPVAGSLKEQLILNAEVLGTLEAMHVAGETGDVATERPSERYRRWRLETLSLLHGAQTDKRW